MPVNLDSDLTLHQDIQIELAEQLLRSESPNTDILVETITVQGGTYYPALKFTANAYNGVVTVAASGNVQNGRLDIAYYKSHDAFEVDMKEAMEGKNGVGNDVMQMRTFLSCNSVHFGAEIKHVAAKTILNFFLCGGNFPEMGYLHAAYPLWATAYIR